LSQAHSGPGASVEKVQLLHRLEAGLMLTRCIAPPVLQSARLVDWPANNE